MPLLVVNKCQNNISLQRLVLLTVLRHMASDDKTRGLGTRVGDAAFKSAFYGSLLGLFVANWRENQAKSAAARAVAAKGPEAVKEYMWAARAEMGGALVRYGAFMGAAGGAYVTGKGLAEAYRGTDDPLNAALGAQAVAALFGVAFKSNRVLAATSLGMGGGMYVFEWLRCAHEEGYKHGFPGLGLAAMAESAHR
uniref:Mitochondrial import inner membrane translocase subunit TIM22 n=1 Tax=Prasinoderma singulare TaxID=676789 RepID=A0A7S3BTW2_9VIRI